ncbi:putative glycosyltransferase EpsJ [Lachnospiraceae bacterium]|nr:putative glycosyltransferase EpsJ [Lachnospiraceae bacterium]
MKKAVSVIIPVYNVENYLTQCLDSVTLQTLNNIEILCIEDCSQDSSLAILQKYADRDQRIRVIKNIANVGLAASRNIGVQHAAGEYIYFLDSDDILNLDAMEVLYKLGIEENLDIIYFDTEEITELSGQISAYACVHQANVHGIYSGSEMFSLLMEQSDWDGCVWRQFYRRSLLLGKTPFREGQLHEDIAFAINIALKAQRVKYLDRPLHKYRRRNGSITARIAPANIVGLLYAYFDVLDIAIHNSSDTRLNGALKERLLQLCAYVRHMYRQCEDIDEIYKSDNPVIGHLLNLITKDLYQGMYPGKISRGKIAVIKKYRDIIIYGAGKAGIGLYEILMDLKIDILGFAVSSLENNEDNLKGKKVKLITEWQEYKGSALVIIAVKRKNLLFEELTALGYENVLNIF